MGMDDTIATRRSMEDPPSTIRTSTWTTSDQQPRGVVGHRAGTEVNQREGHRMDRLGRGHSRMAARTPQPTRSTTQQPRHLGRDELGPSSPQPGARGPVRA
eukprot:6653655-Pyramimonas_sp.AAC.1